MSKLFYHQSLYVAQVGGDGNVRHERMSIGNMFYDALEYLNTEHSTGGITQVVTVLCSNISGRLFWTTTKLMITKSSGPGGSVPIASYISKDGSGEYEYYDSIIDGYVLVTSGPTGWVRLHNGDKLGELMYIDPIPVDDSIDDYGEHACTLTEGNTTLPESVSMSGVRVSRVQGTNNQFERTVAKIESDPENEDTSYECFYVEGLPIGVVLSGLVFRQSEGDNNRDVVAFSRSSYEEIPTANVIDRGWGQVELSKGAVETFHQHKSFS